MLMVVLAAVGGVAPAAAPGRGRRMSGIRLAGTFAMRGTLTNVENVLGERRGERVRRTWSFFPRCAKGACSRVTLKRGRSARRILDVVGLVRKGRGHYVGRGAFWIALRCAGAVVKHGGRAHEIISVRVTRTATVGTTRLATRLSATYTNPSRTNLTRCPGGIGHDAARYQGRLATPLPGPPTADFTDTVDLLTSTASFSDQSQPGTNGPPIVSWSWNFGEPSSPEDTSTRRNPSHRYALPGIHTVTLTIRDQYGQVATTTRQVTV
jgi:PKD domain